MSARNSFALLLLSISSLYACGRSTLNLADDGSGGAGGPGGGPGCVPSAEICNGIDDDCDGSTDEGCACSEGSVQACGVGVCAGTQTCAGGVWGVCSGGAPAPEQCNGIDDDCDGSIDEDCACNDGDVASCGSNVGNCKEGVQTCVGGTWGPCQGGVLPTPESCNGEDDDCNGTIDDPCVCVKGETLPCGTATGACELGQQVCGNGTWGPCMGGIEPSPEICNGLDDDCDSLTDENCDCIDGQVQTCGTSVGACETGQQTCSDGKWGPCLGEIGPTPEACNGIDDDCDGQTDEGFGLGQPCDGPDSDVCLDDVMTCAGCSAGDDDVEACNGVDDDCDSVIDNGCSGQQCSATVVVTDVTPNSPSCFIDSVLVGDTGDIEFPCDGGMATLALGDVDFTGTVTSGQVALQATSQYLWIDGCVWHSTQTITGSLAAGTLAYAYSEMPISGSNCASPCTATGSLDVQ